MKTNSSIPLIVTAVSGFALGVVAGMLFAPESGDKLRARIANEAREQLRQAEARLKTMEGHLRTLDERVASARQQVTQRVRNAAEHARTTLLPTLDAAADALKLEERELSRDLRHMTRK
jgi:gas vesicle protein